MSLATWYLILYIGGNGRSQSVTEYVSESACHKAEQAAIKRFDEDVINGRTVITLCVPDRDIP